MRWSKERSWANMLSINHWRERLPGSYLGHQGEGHEQEAAKYSGVLMKAENYLR